MRPFKYILLFVLGTMFCSCGKDTKDLVEGRWKIEDVTVPLPNAPDSLRPYYQEKMKEQNAELLSSGYYEFKKNGQGFFEINGNRMEGKWRLSDNEKTIFFKEKNDTNETPFEIKEISSSIFIMETGNGDETVRIVMKKQLK